MIRRFNFEDEVHHSLACVPMAVRRKLDRVGVKVSLEQWQALAQHERLAVCHLPTDSAEERDAVRTFVEESVKTRTGTATKPLSEEVKRSADPPDAPPTRLIENARSAGVTLDQPIWDRLGAHPRHAFLKLGGRPPPSPQFPPAVRHVSR